jgi:polyisoprenoid-binding protein YceI
MPRRGKKFSIYSFIPFALMTRSFLAAFTVLLAGTLLAAWSLQSPVSYTIEPTPNEMYVEGGSTLHDWSCPIKGLSGSLEANAAQAADAPPISEVSKSRVQVPVDSIQCDKDTMNEKLREALQMNAYPKVYFSLDDAQVSPLPDSGASWFSVDATGELILAGERRQIELPVQGQHLDNGNIRLTGSHTIRLSDYDIERPSAMLGTIKTSKDVTVHFDVTATPDTN